MKAKEYIIQKLVNLGKKHRWMKYPMLAVVSLISLFFLLLEKCMERPKRAVIALVCLVLIISQSWYLISVASDPSELPQGSGPMGSSTELNGTENPPYTLLSAPSTEEMQYTITYETGGIYENTGGIGQQKEPDVVKESELDSFSLKDGTPNEGDYFKFEGWYRKTGNGYEKVTKVTKEMFGGNNTMALFANFERIAYKLTYAPGSGEGSPHVECVKIVKGSATTTLKDPKSDGQVQYTRTGYTFDSWRIDDSDTNIYSAGSSFTFGSKDVTVYPQWNPIQYTIQFNKNDEKAQGEMEDLTATYDKEMQLPLNTFTKQGFSFAGWQAEDGHTIYPDGGTVTNLTAESGKTYILKAQWEYQAARLTKMETEYAYDQTVNETIGICHDVPNDGDFTATITNVSGETEDGSVTQDTYAATTGLLITTEKNIIQITADKVNTVGTISVTFRLHDNVNTEKEDTYKTLTIHLNKKELTVTGVQNLTKQYDGTTQLPVGTIYFEGAREAADVYLNNHSQNGSFSDANVGENKDIVIEGISLSGRDAKYYTVSERVTLTGGSITKRRVRVTTAPVYGSEEDHILTGQTPQFMVEIQEEDLPEVVAGADKQAILKAIQGHYTCTYGAPDYKAGTYSIGIDATSVVLQNYYLEVMQGNLVVVQEAVNEGDYEIKGSRLSGNQWYYLQEPTIQSLSQTYNSVYVTSDPAATKAKCDSAFSAAAMVSEELAANGTVYIQLGNTQNGAVTAVKAVTLRVDITAPEIDVTQIELKTINSGGAGKLGNFLSFGNFFKEALVITVPVSDTRSGAESLTYYLEGESFETGTTVSVKDGKASFQVSPQYKGTIALIATDKAGNTSVQAKMIGVEGSDYWVVENQAPEVLLTATDNEGRPAYSGEGIFYKSVTATASVADLDAGVAALEWTVTKDGAPYEALGRETVKDSSRILTTYDFVYSFVESGSYTVSVTAYDNADNVSLPTERIQFVIDSTSPEVSVMPEDYDEVWDTQKTVSFTVTDTESGIQSISIQDENGNIHGYTAAAGSPNTYTFTVGKKGTYTITATDRAGNVTEYPVVFTRVSAEVPDTPVLIMDPELPESGWYTKEPALTVQAQEKTPDGTQVFTYYQIWKDGETEPHDFQRVYETISLPGEGYWNIRIWSEAESGLQSEKNVYRLGYDGTAPEIHDVLVTGSGTVNHVTFQVTEETSGLAKLEAIYDENEAYAQSLAFTELGNGVYSASFTAAMTGSYQIRATDAAGNVTYADAFRPMNIIVTSVDGSAQAGITVKGEVIAGSFEIADVSVVYGMTGSGNQKIVEEGNLILTNVKETGNKMVTARLTDVVEDTSYQYRIVATSTTGVTCEYTGFFKTGVEGTIGVNIVGSVLDEAAEEAQSSEISVMLYEGNDVIQSRNVVSGDSFMFTEVPDGMYTVRAANGNRSVSQGINIDNGTVLEPEEALRLVLRSGQKTDVEAEPGNTLSYTVNGLEGLFDDTTNFGSAEDLAVIEAGGTIEFCMTVDELAENEVPESDRVYIMQNMRRNEKVLMYVDFSIWKRAMGAYGLISETQITSISGGKAVRIVIPLPNEYAGRENLSVIRIHDHTAERLSDLDTNPNTYTISSSLFSTYALVYMDESGNNNNVTNGPNQNSAQDTGTGAGGSTSDLSKGPNPGSILTSNNYSTTPKTGDESPVIWVSLLGLTAVFSLGILQWKRKR